MSMLSHTSESNSAFDPETPREFSRRNVSPSSPSSSLTAIEPSDDMPDDDVTIIDPIARASDESKNLADDIIIVEGREFLNDLNVKYIFPVDDAERERILQEHYLFRYLWKGNFSAPVEEDLLYGANVLDVACGPGAWVMDMSTQYKESSFVGIDVAHKFPTADERPSNAAFLKCNLLEGLPFAKNTFNYVRHSFLLGSINTALYEETVLPEMIRVCCNGGYIEIMDIDIMYHNGGPIVNRIVDVLVHQLKKIDVTYQTAAFLIQALRKRPELTVSEKLEKIHPLGPWAGRLGELLLKNFLGIHEAMRVVFPKALGITSDEYTQMLEDYAVECNANKTYLTMYRLVARVDKTR